MALRRLQPTAGAVSRSLHHPLASGSTVWILSSSAGPPSSGPQQRRAASSSSKLPAAPFPIFTNIRDYRKWRRHVQRSAILSSSSSSSSSAEASAAELAAEEQAGSVGFVPTMGALHAGHLDLVRRSLQENRHTVVSIFVNPAQFAPTEDLASYPRTLESDIAALVGLEKEVELSSSSSFPDSTAQGGKDNEKAGRISAIFCPDVREMYPPLPGTQTPFTQNVSQQQGAFIEVQGLSSVLEGKSRPGFFRGVATVVTKLWHVVEPTRVYFGQKDIQQAIILRALLTSLLFQSPSSSTSGNTFRLVPTTRDEHTGLALSSRNAYLSPAGLRWAPTLYRALSAARDDFEAAVGSFATGEERARKAREARAKAEEIVARASEEAKSDGVRLELDYVSFNSSATLVEIGSSSSGSSGSGGDDKGEELQRQGQEEDVGGGAGEGAVLSGAMWVIEGERRTRMIDNLLLGSARKLLASASSASSAS